MSSPATGRFRTARDILVPRGTNIVYVHKMRKEVDRTALAIMRAGEDMHYEWTMFWDDALRAGLIEKVDDG